jgi:hypothetical protein
MQTPTSPDDTSWWDELINAATGTQRQVPPPPAPQPPPVDQSAWEKSVEQAKISDSLGTVHDLGLRIYQETKSYSDRPNANEPIDAAREKMAWTVMNGDKTWGFDRQKHASTALPIEPSPQELRNPDALAAYQSSMGAAREAYLGWKDPTNGALHLSARTDPGQYNWKPRGMTGPGKPIKTHSGPYNNSYTKGDTPSSVVWLNTYED